MFVKRFRSRSGRHKSVCKDDQQKSPLTRKELRSLLKYMYILHLSFNSASRNKNDIAYFVILFWVIVIKGDMEHHL